MNWSWYVWIIAILLGGGAGYGFFKLMKPQAGNVIIYIAGGVGGALAGFFLRWLVGVIIGNLFGGIIFGLLGAGAAVLLLYGKLKK